MTDWQAWHGDYDDPASSLSRRLVKVRQRLAELLDGHREVRSILSLCAGDGRDVIPAVAALPPEERPGVVLVELDKVLASAARKRAAEARVEATVIAGDAGLVETWHAAVPVDLLMLCGIFGNVSDDDVHATVRAATSLLNPGGAVIWTRGHRDGDDMRPVIRQWFDEAGFDELAFDAEPTGYGVGVNRLRSGTDAGHVPERLFTFVR